MENDKDLEVNKEGGFVLKSYNEIVRDMLVSFQTYMPAAYDIRPGTVLCTLFEAMAIQMADLQYQMQNMYTQFYNQAQAASQPKTYTFPDGTQGTNKPKDGEKFDLIAQNSIDHYMWDGFKEQWFRTGTTLALNTPVEFAVVNLDMSALSEMKCECGSETAGSNKHSSWCKKFTPDF